MKHHNSLSATVPAPTGEGRLFTSARLPDPYTPDDTAQAKDKLAAAIEEFGGDPRQAEFKVTSIAIPG